MKPLDEQIKSKLDEHLAAIGDQLNADVIAIRSPILPGLDVRLRAAIDAILDKRSTVVLILDTPGGVVEIVERMVTAIRFIYGEVIAIVPDRAMSAGTILALSADRIMMDHLSCLGPIDPQIQRDGNLFPALSYLNQFERLNRKSEEGELTTAEYALLNKLDLGELYQFEQARELSIELLIKWLSRYKFKDWKVTETSKRDVTPKMRKKRAEQIAALLNDSDRWHSHGRAIDMKTLQDEVGLKIDNLEDETNTALHGKIREYFQLLDDYMHRENLLSFVHTKGFSNEKGRQRYYRTQSQD